MNDSGIQKLMDGAEAASGEQILTTDAGRAPLHEKQQLDLALSVRRKIRLASFGGHNLVMFAVPKQNGFTQTGSGGKQRLSGWGLYTRIQSQKMFRQQMRDTQSPGLQIV